RRLERGESPVPVRYRTGAEGPARAAPAGAAPPPRPAAVASAPAVRGPSSVERQRLLARLGDDPSLRHTEAGRRALRWLHHYSVDGESIGLLGQGLPCHWAPEVADLARSCAAAWNELAEQLQQRTR
ncbi:transcriptional regulator, partial [Streptomyces albidoflavus]